MRFFFFFITLSHSPRHTREDDDDIRRRSDDCPSRRFWLFYTLLLNFFYRLHKKKKSSATETEPTSVRTARPLCCDSAVERRRARTSTPELYINAEPLRAHLTVVWPHATSAALFNTRFSSKYSDLYTHKSKPFIFSNSE